MIGPLVGQLAGELTAWYSGNAFTPPEDERAGVAIEGADQAAHAYALAGHRPRHDDFFTSADGSVPWGAGLFEASLKAAARDSESRKAIHLGRFWTNTAHNPEVDLADALLQLDRARGLSYRQFVLLALAGRAADEPWQSRLAQAVQARGQKLTSSKPSLEHETVTLAERRLLSWTGVPTGEGAGIGTPQAAGDYVMVSKLALTAAGQELHDALSLAFIPKGEFERLIADFAI